MQLDDNDLEKDNNEISLDDTDNDTISWDDLLNNEGGDFSDVAQSMNETTKEDDKGANIDVLAGSEDFSGQEPQAEVQPEETSDIGDNGGVDVVSYDSETEPFVSEDEILMSDDTQEISVDGADLSGIVDDELLSLLDDDGDKPKEENESEAPVIASDVAEISSSTGSDIEQWLNTPSGSEEVAAEEAKIPVSEDQEINNDTSYNDEDVEINSVPDKKGNSKAKKSSAPILAIVFVVLILFCGYFYWDKFYNKPVIADNDQPSDSQVYELPMAPSGADVGIDAPSPSTGGANADAPVPAHPEDNVDTKELIDKVSKNKEENEEKKVIINVQTGGRSNPFVPSSLFNDKGYASIGANIPVPPEGVIDSPEAAEARKLMTISVSGIMFDPSKPSAILRFDGKDYFVQKGDRIDTYTVNQITKEYVAIRNAANIYKAYVGETFKIDEVNIPPSNQMKYRGKTRQYISADDIQISTK